VQAELTQASLGWGIQHRLRVPVVAFISQVQQDLKLSISAIPWFNEEISKRGLAAFHKGIRPIGTHLIACIMVSAQNPAVLMLSGRLRSKHCTKGCCMLSGLCCCY